MAMMMLVHYVLAGKTFHVQILSAVVYDFLKLVHAYNLIISSKRIPAPANINKGKWIVHENVSLIQAVMCLFRVQDRPFTPALWDCCSSKTWCVRQESLLQTKLNEPISRFAKHSSCA